MRDICNRSSNVVCSMEKSDARCEASSQKYRWWYRNNEKTAAKGTSRVRSARAQVNGKIQVSHTRIDIDTGADSLLFGHRTLSITIYASFTVLDSPQSTLFFSFKSQVRADLRDA